MRDSFNGIRTKSNILLKLFIKISITYWLVVRFYINAYMYIYI